MGCAAPGGSASLDVHTVEAAKAAAPSHTCLIVFCNRDDDWWTTDRFHSGTMKYGPAGGAGSETEKKSTVLIMDSSFQTIAKNLLVNRKFSHYHVFLHIIDPIIIRLIASWLADSLIRKIIVSCVTFGIQRRRSLKDLHRPLVAGGSKGHKSGRIQISRPDMDLNKKIFNPKYVLFLRGCTYHTLSLLSNIFFLTSLVLITILML